jgi:hypothetical protein
MNSSGAETHLILVWDRARPALDRILDDASRRFTVRDVVEVTWRPEHFRRSLSRLYGTDLPQNSDKERESGTGPFVVVVVDDLRPRTVARKTQWGWAPANAALLEAKRRYRAWAGGSYRVHTTLTPGEATKDAVLILGESPAALHGRMWNGVIRQRGREPLGDPNWTSVHELRTALTATMRCAFPPRGQPDALFEVITDDAWWAVRIIDPAVAEGRQDPHERLRRPIVAGAELPVLVRDVSDPDADPTWDRLLPHPEPLTIPTLGDRLAALVRRRI